MRNTERPHLCTCGKLVTGPLARYSHRKACTGHRWLSDQEAYSLRKFAADQATTEGG